MIFLRYDIYPQNTEIGLKFLIVKVDKLHTLILIDRILSANFCIYPTHSRIKETPVYRKSYTTCVMRREGGGMGGNHCNYKYIGKKVANPEKDNRKEASDLLLCYVT